MTEEVMISYLESTGLYGEDDNFSYERKMMNTDKTIPISDLVERFIDADEYFHGEPWNIRQILANINMILPVEDRQR